MRLEWPLHIDEKAKWRLRATMSRMASQEIDLEGPSTRVVNVVEFPRNIGVLRVRLAYQPVWYANPRVAS